MKRRSAASFIRSTRDPVIHRVAHDPWSLQGVHRDQEPDETGALVHTAAVLLTGRQCPWSCVMCDLWQHTLEHDTPVGAIPRQIELAIAALRQDPDEFPACLKLYNAGSFFDPRAVPPSDYPAIADLVAPFERVVVESHPSLIGPRVDQWLSVCDSTLEVAMGLETANPEALKHLNKGMTVDAFQRAAEQLAVRAIGLRVFLLLHPPFIPVDEQDVWLLRSLDVAIDSGATATSLIPLRLGNDLLNPAAGAGDAEAPTLATVERALALALEHVRSRQSRLRVFVDTWDLERLEACDRCGDATRARVLLMNLSQVPEAPVPCAH